MTRSTPLSAIMQGPLTFAQTYGHPVHAMPTADIDPNTAQLRIALIAEELDEFIVAAQARDIVEIADALGDLMYVVAGAAVTYGIDLDAVFEEIQRSNMSKLGPDGQPIVRADGKILKGPDFFEPNLAAVLDAQEPLFTKELP